jgi:two-component system sensor histidine kinase GlrK
MRPADRYYPRSFLKLLLLGFFLVLLPPSIAFYGTTSYVEHLSSQGQQAVYDAAQVARGSRILVEQITDMERSARQYAILRDSGLLDNYHRARERFDQAVADLAQLPLAADQQKRLTEASAHVAAIDKLLSAGPPRPAQAKLLAAEFVALSDLADMVLANGNGLIEREIAHMKSTSAEAQRIQIWQMLATLPLGLLIALGFSFLIARPVRQIDSAIRQLGNAEFSAEIRVNGPADLRYLGQQLDWLRQRLVQLEEQKSRFLRGVSHELKTPLTALHEGIGLLGDGVGGSLSENQQEILTILRSNTTALQVRIEALLDFQRAQFEASAMQMEKVDLAALARSVSAEQTIPALARKVTIATHIEPLRLHCDGSKIHLILENLLVNAVKYSPRGGTVTLDILRHDDEVWIEVADQGPGIASDDRERVFEWFYHGRMAPDNVIKGSGLGLAIAQEIAHAHNGSIEVVQQTEPGARFRVRLPLIVEADNGKHK